MENFNTARRWFSLVFLCKPRAISNINPALWHWFSTFLQSVLVLGVNPSLRFQIRIYFVFRGIMGISCFVKFEFLAIFDFFSITFAVVSLGPNHSLDTKKKRGYRWKFLRGGTILSFTKLKKIFQLEALSGYLFWPRGTFLLKTTMGKLLTLKNFQSFFPHWRLGQNFLPIAHP